MSVPETEKPPTWVDGRAHVGDDVRLANNHDQRSGGRGRTQHAGSLEPSPSPSQSLGRVGRAIVPARCWPAGRYSALAGSVGDMAQHHRLSRGAFERLKAEHDDLTTRGRIEIARKIETARELGDLSENGDY